MGELQFALPFSRLVRTLGENLVSLKSSCLIFRLLLKALPEMSENETFGRKFVYF